MKPIFIIGFALLLFSCQSKQNSIEEDQKEGASIRFIKLENQAEMDTVLEKNSPENLDLNKHQFYIDTTNTSQWYDSIETWSSKRRGGMRYYINELLKEYSAQVVSNNPISEHWIELRQYEGELMVYEPGDGIGMRYQFTDSFVAEHHVWESDGFLIQNYDSTNREQMSYTVACIKELSETRRIDYSISKTSRPYVYLLKKNIGDFNSYALITPLEHIRKFPMMVNHEVGNKVAIYAKWDKIDFTKFF